jgi:VWFA-related protein
LSQTRQKPTPVEQAEDVVRINTELVQTDVMVFDKQGHFVNGLHAQDFNLRIDGKSQPISFFELVSTGSANEESQLVAARDSRPGKDNNGPVSVDLDRRRVIFFYVDDLHLAANNLVRARKLLLSYIEKDMRQNDEAGITSASGQIGFLQQLTDNKTVLRAAIERLIAIELRFRSTISALEVRESVARIKRNIRARHPDVTRIFFGAESISGVDDAL